MDQTEALAILKTGQNVFLTGSAGTGKTWVLNQYIQYLRDRKVHVAVTASTGIAATHMQGMTIHAWSGIGVREYLSPRALANLKTKKYLKKNLDGVKVLIIDEISMLHRRQLELVNQVLQAFRENTDPFGGIQVVFSGDFFQLPPVGQSGESNKEKFAFMSKAWLDARLTICYLIKQYRQEDSNLDLILDEIRQQRVSEKSISLLQKTAEKPADKDWDPTRLYTHNIDAGRINRQELEKLGAPIRTYSASLKGNEKLREALAKSVLAEETLKLCEGAKVMFVKNNYEKGFVNGTMGKVISFADSGDPVIHTVDGKKIVAEEEKWSMDDDHGASLASFSQVPVRLAWAITVHKCQGMTLESAEVDLTKTFEKGQGYVALSRLRNLKNLNLVGFNEVALQVDRLAWKADQRFIELCEEATGRFSEEELADQAKSFLILVDGLSDEHAIRKHKRKRAERKDKRSTVQITGDLVADGMSIAEIAMQRGLAQGTVLGHLAKLGDEIDLSRFRPAASVMASVRKAHSKLKKQNDPDKFQMDGTVKIGAIYSELKSRLTYDEIKLALVFVE